jgi:hypothetical protein
MINEAIRLYETAISCDNFGKTPGLKGIEKNVQRQVRKGSINVLNNVLNAIFSS